MSLDIGDLSDDIFTQAEAVALVSALANAYFLVDGYIVFMRDLKAAHWPSRAAECVEKAIRCSYPPKEGDFLIARARAAADAGIRQQRANMEASDAVRP